MRHIALGILILLASGCSGLKVTAGVGFGGFSLSVERQPMAFEQAPSPEAAPTQIDED